MHGLLASIQHHLCQDLPSQVQLEHELWLSKQQHKLALLVFHLATEIRLELSRLDIAAQQLERDVDRDVASASLSAFVELKDVKLALHLRRMSNTYSHYTAKHLLPESEAKTYLDPLPPSSIHALQTFITLIISSPSLSVISRSLTSQINVSSLGSRLKSFFMLLRDARGPKVLAQFAEMILVQLIEDLSTSSSDVARMKELEAAVLDVLESLHGLEVSISLNGPSGTNAHSVKGPFVWGEAVELVLLELLRNGRQLLRGDPFAAPARALSASTNSSGRPSRGHAATQSVSSHGFSNFLAAPSRLFSSTSPSGIGSNYRPHYISLSSKSDLTLLILKQASAFIQALTTTKSSSLSLVFYLCRKILSERYPEDSSSRKKLLLLVVVRFFAFMRLSKMLSTLSTSTTLCCGCIIESRDTSELFLPLHSRIYSAIVEAAGLAQDEAKLTEDVLDKVDSTRHTEALQELKQLRQAARQFLRIWSTPVSLYASPVKERPFLVSKHALFELFDLGPPLVFSAASPTFPSTNVFADANLQAPLPSFKRVKNLLPSTPTFTANGGEENDAGLLSMVAVALAQIKNNHRSSVGSKEDWALFYATCSEGEVHVAQEPAVAGADQRKANRTPDDRGATQGKPEALTKDEATLLRRSVELLCRGSSAASNRGDLLTAFQDAAAEALDAHQFPANILFTKAAALLSDVAKTRPSLAEDGFSPLLRPIHSSYAIAADARQARRTAIQDVSKRLAAQVQDVLESTRRLLTQIDTLRSRCWFLAIKHSPEYNGLINKLAGFAGRSAQQQAEALQAVRSHNASAGIQMFFDAVQGDAPTAEFLEVLVAVDTVVSQSLSLSKILASPFWKLESLVIDEKVQREAHAEGGFMEGSRKAANFFISAPSLFLGPLFGETTAVHVEVPKNYAISAVGAVPRLFADADLSVNAVQSWVIHVRMRLIGYALSHLENLGLFSIAVPVWFDSSASHVSSSDLPENLQPFRAPIRTLLASFALQPAPLKKFELLYDLVTCVGLILSHPSIQVASPTSDPKDERFESLGQQLATKLSTFKEANEKTPVFSRAVPVAEPVPLQEMPRAVSPDDLLVCLESILQCSSYRPKALLSHLQILASLLPEHFLNRAAEGKAFWDVSLAALSLKKDAVDALVKQAVDQLATGLEDGRLDARTAILTGALEGSQEALELKPSFGGFVLGALPS